jgi:hypothetical protein
MNDNNNEFQHAASPASTPEAATEQQPAERVEIATWDERYAIARRRCVQGGITNDNSANLAASTAGAAATSENARDESGWCLERGPASAPHYLHVAETGIFDWTLDHMKALRLARRADAEQVACIVEDADRVAEHVWTDMSAMHATQQEGGNA